MKIELTEWEFRYIKRLVSQSVDNIVNKQLESNSEGERQFYENIHPVALDLFEKLNRLDPRLHDHSQDPEEEEEEGDNIARAIACRLSLFAKVADWCRWSAILTLI